MHLNWDAICRSSSSSNRSLFSYCLLASPLQMPRKWANGDGTNSTRQWRKEPVTCREHLQIPAVQRMQSSFQSDPSGFAFCTQQKKRSLILPSLWGDRAFAPLEPELSTGFNIHLFFFLFPKTTYPSFSVTRIWVINNLRKTLASCLYKAGSRVEFLSGCIIFQWGTTSPWAQMMTLLFQAAGINFEPWRISHSCSFSLSSPRPPKCT